MRKNYLSYPETLMLEFIHNTGYISKKQFYVLMNKILLFKAKKEDTSNYSLNYNIIYAYKSLGLMIKHQHLFTSGEELKVDPRMVIDEDVLLSLWVIIDNLLTFDSKQLKSIYLGTYPSSLLFGIENTLIETVVIEKDDFSKLYLLNQKYLNYYTEDECILPENPDNDDVIEYNRKLEKRKSIPYKYILIFKDASMIEEIPSELDFISDKNFICCTVNTDEIDAFDIENAINDENLSLPQPLIEYYY